MTKQLKIDHSLEEVRGWKEQVSQEYEGCSSTEVKVKMKQGAEEFIEKYNLKLKYAPLPNHTFSPARKSG